VPISGAPPVTPESTGGAAENVRGLLARQLQLDPAAVVITRVTPAEWPDACLGTAAEDEICAQVVTPGFELTYQVDGATYRYRSDLTGSRARLVEAPPPAVGDTVAACLPATATTQRLNNTDGRYCLTPTSETQLFDDPGHGFCLLYPAGFTAKTPSENTVLISSGSPQNAGAPRLSIEMQDAGGRTAWELADAAVAWVQAAVPSHQIDRPFGVTLGYQKVERLDGMPRQDLSRQLIGVVGGRAYRLIFTPDDPAQGDAYGQMEALYDLVVKSFLFLN
jgi:hypothetical protein